MISLNELRNRSSLLANSLPYQLIKDSPTIKYYTNWKAFDKFHLPGDISELKEAVNPVKLPSSVNLLIAGRKMLQDNVPDKVQVTPLNEIFSQDIKTRADAIHYASIIQALDIHFIEQSSIFPFRLTIESILGGDIHEGYHVRIFIHDKSSVDLEIFEIALSDLSAYNSIIELIINENSNVNLTHVVISNSHSPSMSHLKIILNENSSLKINSLCIGGLMHRQQVYSLIRGNNSRMNANAALLGDKENKIDYVFDSMLKGSNNELIFNGLAIAEDKGYVSMRAIGRISEVSKNALVDVRGHTYNIGSEATAIGSPVLEINSNNVRLARHSVSISNISEDILFYLMSRGLSLGDSKKIFKSELMSRVIAGSNDYVREDVREVLEILLNTTLPDTID